MKTLITLIFICLSLSSFAQSQTGIGISLGNPTGLNGKHWLNGTQAVDGGLGWSLGKHTEVSMHSDFLLHEKGAFFLNEVHPLDLYYGIGGRMEFADDIELGVRVPVGLVHMVDDQPADIFAEVAPIMNLVPGTTLELHLMLGARYYFK